MHIGILGPMSIDLLPIGDAPELEGLPGYPAPIVSSVVRGYLERGARVTAITTSTGLGDTVLTTSGRLKLIVVPRARPRSALTFFRSERQAIQRALAEDPPDVLHAHWTYEFAAAALDAGIPTLVTAHDDAHTIFRFQPTLYRLLRLLLDAHVVRAASHVSTPSEYLASRIASRVRAPITVIPNCIGAEMAVFDGAEAPRGRAVVTVSNGFSGRKNVAASVEAFANSNAVQQGWTYVLIGQGLGPDGEAAEWARRKGMDRGLCLRGPLTYAQTLDAIERASIMIHPALEESFGMTVLEAMALGTPVIGGVRSGNVPALLADGCGVLCDVSSPSSITRELDELVARSDNIDQIGARAHARAVCEYGVDRVIGQYLDVLSALLEKPGSTEIGL